MRKSERNAVIKALARNNCARVRHAMIWQDRNDRREEEIFLANMTKKEFDQLSLSTKRLAGPGRNYHGDIHQRGSALYVQLWGDNECFGVFVQKGELKRRRIPYELSSPE